MLQSGELPVGAVTAVAHGPGNEGSSGHRRPEDYGGESSALLESGGTDPYQGVRECEGGDATALSERVFANRS